MKCAICSGTGWLGGPSSQRYIKCECQDRPKPRRKRSTDALRRVAEKLRKAGATVPAPEVKGTIESSILTGMSIALLLIEGEIERSA